MDRENLWVAAALVALMFVGCALFDSLGSDESQVKLTKIEDTLLAIQATAKVATVAVPAAAPITGAVGWGAGILATLVGMVAEYGRRRQKKALVAVVEGTEFALNQAQSGSLTVGALKGHLERFQNKTGTRVLVRRVIEKVNGGGKV